MDRARPPEIIPAVLHSGTVRRRQGGVLVVAVLFILVTLLTDVIVGWLDPRIEEGAAA